MNNFMSDDDKSAIIISRNNIKTSETDPFDHNQKNIQAIVLNGK